ncbi:MAG: GAF domain-containing protein [Coriobacteriales bacterium]|nr:GAF domain-containing protein [Coriobacteriales bacterium]
MVSYELLVQQIRELAKIDRTYLPVLANTAALLYETLDDINWAGFYLLNHGSLMLGPFQGRPACVRIPVGKGVCGTAVKNNSIQCVANVHEFPGHITCDSASNSEIVIPIHKDDHVIGVLDIDSPLFSRFGASDEKGLQDLVTVLEEETDFAGVQTQLSHKIIRAYLYGRKRTHYQTCQTS